MLRIKMHGYMLKDPSKPYSLSCKALKSKWIKEFNIKTDILNLIAEKVGNSCELIGIEDKFSEENSVSIGLDKLKFVQPQR